MAHPEDLQKLLVYRNIIKDDLVQKLICFCVADKVLPYEIAHDLIKQAENLGLEGNVLHNYLVYLIAHDENIFSVAAEKTGGIIGSSLTAAVIEDIKIIKNFIAGDFCSQLGIDILKSYSPAVRQMSGDFQELCNIFLDETSQYTPEQVELRLEAYYLRHGYGDIAEYAFFRWDGHGKLAGIKHFDPVTFDDIVGYEQQKHTLLTNTESFLANSPYHHVLLVGARGTGKSSSVKALVNKYFHAGLRLVEVPKEALKDIPTIMNVLHKYGKKFILFLDDLSFEESEIEYKHLKSVLEGGVELTPENVLICATSNHRHLIHESWQDRYGSTNDVHRLDSVHEKLSLSDRFGIILTYLTPTQEEYMHMIEEIAKKENLPLSPAQLKSEALHWEMLHSGRSGRIARQFITHLLASSTLKR